MRCRRGVILPVVLLILVLLGLLVAMFSFRVNADLATTRAVELRMQTRLAAEAGVERVKLLLRESRLDMDRWYHNPEELHRIIFWVEDGDETVWGTNDEFEEELAAYRFSILADDPSDDEDLIRIGITDESSKLNLNTASAGQLLKLVRRALGDDVERDPRDIVDAILDWRDADTAPRGKDPETEGLYYQRLPKPYRVKNGPFDSVEELLLVKGVTGPLLYGEDFDRNGLLTPNEDDGDLTFPPDNEDGMLNLGLFPYLTVLSSERNVSNDNRPRVYLLGDADLVEAELTAAFPDEPALVEFIVRATRPGGGNQGGANTGNADGAGGPSDESNQGNEGASTNDPNADETGSGGGESNGAGESPRSMASPASLLRDALVDGQTERSIVTLAHLPVLMDRTTVVKDTQQEISGLININTATKPVLETIDGLTTDQIDAILELRQRLGAETKATTAWLLTEEVVDLDTFERVSSAITARGQQFTIESLGYGDHIGMVTRLHVVIDMVGPIAETIYYRDITYLGGHYPIREEDKERAGVQ